MGWFFGIFEIQEFFNFVPRIWIGAAENLVLVAVPAFIVMGIMMERSGVAHRMLYSCQVLLRRVPGALCLSVTVMGTILAAMTGIIGASVTMMTAMALPTMLKQGYDQGLATGSIGASGCLGILIPPSIMLIIMADLLSISVGSLFMAALGPGLLLASLYLLYILFISKFRPSADIFGLTPHSRVMNQMALYWGIQPIQMSEIGNVEQLIEELEKLLLKLKLVSAGDKLVILTGAPIVQKGSTTLMKLHEVKAV